MRLLKNDFTLTDDIHNPPPYTILSHTWEEEEVQFRDVGDRSKKGWRKLEFCVKQTVRDGLEHCWIDTCCIDKSSSAELTEALNSMFKWYANAQKCYVFLSDVSTLDELPSSRWFRRGWTLQELISPRTVEFFNKEGELLGTRKTLEKQISEITGIPSEALSSLHGYTMDELQRWMRGRETTREEDMVYSLLGLLEVNMPVIYGEGLANAQRRLLNEPKSDLSPFSIPIDLSSVIETSKFIAREAELRQMHTALAGDGRRYAVLSGLGGIGKTQLALAYALKHKDDYTAIFWMDARDGGGVQNSYAQVQRQLGVTSIDEVKTWLSSPRNTRWLMICDNHDEPDFDLKSCLPGAPQGAIIVTSRLSSINLGRTVQIAVPTLQLLNSFELLAETSGRDLKQDTHAQALITRLDGLPLALATAGGFLRQTSMSCKQYIQQLDTSWAALQKLSKPPQSYDRALYTTWQTSFEQVKVKNQWAADWLQIWAYLDKNDVWFELVHRIEMCTNFLDQSQELEYHSAMSLLCDYGLAQPGKQPQVESRGYSIHACLHDWLREIVNESWSDVHAQVALQSVAAHFGTNDDLHANLVDQRLYSHVAVCVRHYDRHVVSDDMLTAYHRIGCTLHRLQRYEEALHIWSKVLQSRIALDGAGHATTIFTGHRVCEVSMQLGGSDVHLCRQVLVWSTVHFGEYHAQTFRLSNLLIQTESATRGMSLTEAAYINLIELEKKKLPADDQVTLLTMHNLAILYHNNSRLEEAAVTLNAILAAKHRKYGVMSVTCVPTLLTLGDIYIGTHELDRALSMFRRALEICENLYGPEHEHTLECLCLLGVCLGLHDRYYEAEQVYSRAAKRYPATEASRKAFKELATCYYRQKKYHEAAPALRRVLDDGLEGSWAICKPPVDTENA